MKREDLKAAAKFRATCERCGKRSPRPATDTTTNWWMQRHEREHRTADREGTR